MASRVSINLAMFMYLRLLASFAESYASRSDSRKESDRVKLVAGVLTSG